MKRRYYHRWLQKKLLCTNKYSIGEMIGAHVTSIVKWGYLDNFKPVYLFFYENILNTQKIPNPKQMILTLLEVVAFVV